MINPVNVNNFTSLLTNTTKALWQFNPRPFLEGLTYVYGRTGLGSTSGVTLLSLLVCERALSFVWHLFLKLFKNKFYLFLCWSTDELQKPNATQTFICNSKFIGIKSDGCWSVTLGLKPTVYFVFFFSWTFKGFVCPLWVDECCFGLSFHIGKLLFGALDSCVLWFCFFRSIFLFCSSCALTLYQLFILFYSLKALVFYCLFHCSGVYQRSLSRLQFQLRSFPFRNTQSVWPACLATRISASYNNAYH